MAAWGVVRGSGHFLDGRASETIFGGVSEYDFRIADCFEFWRVAACGLVDSAVLAWISAEPIWNYPATDAFASAVVDA